MNQEQVEQLRKLYPKGTRIRIHEMKGDYQPVPKGTYGTVQFVDDAGTIHMTWDNGRGLGAVIGENDFTVIARPDQLPEKIKVLIVEPDQHPRVETITNSAQTICDMVGEYFDEIRLDNYAVLIYNARDKLQELEPNRLVGKDMIAGTFVIVADQGFVKWVSLQEDQIETYSKQFYEIDKHSLQEVLALPGMNM